MIQEIQNNKFWTMVDHALMDQKVALFLGAGVSSRPPCSLPLFNRLLALAVSSVRNNLPREFQDHSPVINVYQEQMESDGENFPLTKARPEYTFGMLIETNPNVLSWICSIYSTDSYSAEHLVVAAMLKAGFVKSAFTTNFDNCLENALEASGLILGQDYEVIVGEFPSNYGQSSVQSHLVKLHGSVTDPLSIRITLEQEYCKYSVDCSLDLREEGMIHILHYEQSRKDYFKSVAAKKSLLFLGYSGRDTIFRWLLELESHQPIFWLFYNQASEQEVEFVLNQAQSLRGDFIFARGNVSDILSLPSISYRESYTPKLSAEQGLPELKWNPKDALIAFCGFLKDMFPRALIRLLQVTEDRIRPLLAENDGLAVVLADAYQLQGRIDAAIDCYQAAVRTASLRGDVGNELYHKSLLALANTDAGNFDRASKMFEEIDASGMVAQLGLIRRAWHVYHLAEFRRILGYYSEALLDVEFAIRLADDQGLLALLALAFNTKGMLLQRVGRTDEALQTLEDSLSLKKEIGLERVIGNTLNNIGTLYCENGDIKRGLECFLESVEAKKNCGDEFGLCSAYTNLGGVYFGLGNLNESEKYTRLSIEQKKKVGDLGRLASSLLNLGTLLILRGEIKNALNVWEECANLAAAPILFNLKVYIDKIKLEDGLTTESTRKLQYLERTINEKLRN
jgi:tetratricopeptide (TPR) repeat protein